MSEIRVTRLKAPDVSIASDIASAFLDSSEVDEGRLQEMLADPSNIVIAAMTEQRPVGFLVAHHFQSLDGRRQIYLYDIAVTRGFRRKGLGRKMVNLLKSIGSASGVRSIWVGSSDTNTAACGLWTATGARKVPDKYIEYTFELEHPNQSCGNGSG